MLSKSFVLAASVTTLCVVLNGPTLAQEKRPLSVFNEGATGNYIQQLTLDAGDVQGHQVRAYEIQRTYATDSGPVIDGERVVEVWTRGTSDLSNGIGPAYSYTTWNTDKGSKIFLQSIGTTESKATEVGFRRGTFQGMSKIVGGTGKFAKIRGVLVDKATFDTNPKGGYSTVESKGEYWFDN